MKLEAGQVAVVTGGASGIGYALAEAFVGRGLQVVVADVEAPALELAVDRLGGRGGGARGVQTDVSDLEQVQTLAARVLDELGRVDVVCNNAGVFAGLGPMWEIDRADWEWIVRVNLWGVINGITTFVPHLVAQGKGHVVNTSSMAGIALVPYIGAYTAAKCGVVGLSESLAVELKHAAPGVGVSVLCPGLVDTNIVNAERNRPADLRRPSAPPADPAPGQVTGDDVTGGSDMLAPAEVAADALAAIESGRLHVMTAPGGDVLVRQRVDHLLADVTDD